MGQKRPVPPLPPSERDGAGFGMKMLLKMGYEEGKGLGASQQGIREPIAVSLRAAKSGLGYSNEERTAFVDVDVERETQRKDEPRLKLSKKLFSLPKAEEQEIIASSRTERFAEFRNTLAFLIQREKESLKRKAQERVDREIRHQRLVAESKSIQEEIRETKQKLSSLQNTAEEIEKLKEGTAVRVETNFMEGLCYSVFLSNLRLVEDQHIFEFFDSLCHNYGQTRFYRQLLSEKILPILRRQLVNQPLNKELFEEIRKWHPILPQSLMDQVTLQLLVPKLSHYLSASPKNLKSLTPFLGLLKSYSRKNTDSNALYLLAELYAQLGRCLSSAFLKQPTYDLLESFEQVLPQRDYSLFIERTVIPYLRVQLESLDVDPSDQDITPIQTIISYPSLYHLLQGPLERILLPKLISALKLWIESEHADLGEISEWYLAWRRLLEPIQLNDEFFSPLLALMSQHLS